MGDFVLQSPIFYFPFCVRLVVVLPELGNSETALDFG
jgi:hypothetical protein